MRIKIRQLICKRCGHQWVPRISEVIRCARCKSRLWNKQKKKK